MERLKWGILVLVFPAAIGAAAWFLRHAQYASDGPQASFPKRIVSLSPSLTEILFALDLGPRIVGVTQFCDFPLEAKEKPKTGDWIAPQLETIASLRPDLVVLQTEHGEVGERIRGLGIGVLCLPQHTLSVVRNAFLVLGQRCGAEEAAQKAIGQFDGHWARVLSRSAGLPRPRVAVVVSRNYGSGTIGQVMLAGASTFFSELLQAAGAQNAYQDQTIPFPSVTLEHLIKMAPDVILDVCPDLGRMKVSQEAALADWKVLPDLPAVRQDRIYLLTQPYAAKLGPRLLLLLDDLSLLLHPSRAASGKQAGD